MIFDGFVKGCRCSRCSDLNWEGQEMLIIVGTEGYMKILSKPMPGVIFMQIKCESCGKLEYKNELINNVCHTCIRGKLRKQRKDK